MKILSINRHTGWMYMFSMLGFQIDIISDVGEGWNYNNRPLPPNCRLIKSDQVDWNIYDHILVHSMKDVSYILKAIIKKKRVTLVIHGKARRESNFFRYLIKIISLKSISLLNIFTKSISFVFISPTVKESWLFTEGKVIKPGIVRVDEIDPIEIKDRISNKRFILIGNNIARKHFKVDYLKEIVKARDCKLYIVGNNDIKPIQGENVVYVEPKSFQEYISIIRKGFFCISILSEPEDGYNLSLLDSMSLGIPVVALEHATSPVVNNFNGFIFESEKDIAKIVEKIINLEEKEYSRLCINCLLTIDLLFSFQEFKRKWCKVLEDGS